MLIEVEMIRRGRPPKASYKGQSKLELEAAREIGAAKEDLSAEELMRKLVQTAERQRKDSLAPDRR